MDNSIESIISFINRNDRFLIATHINPEADALGSAIALSIGLESAGKKTVIYDKDGVPDIYGFLPEKERVKNRLPSGCNEFSLILLDCNTPERAGIEKDKTFRNSAVIDHHETERDFGDVKWIDPKMPATGLMIYKLLKAMELHFTETVAVNLYTAIAVDTGTFRFANTTPEVLRAASELAGAGARPALIAEALYESWSMARFGLLLSALNCMEISDGIALMTITKDMFKKTGALPEDTENFSSFPRTVRGVSVSVLFRETDGGWKASLRSKGDINVARIAEDFGGGGHKNAAGFTSKTDIETTKRLFLEKLKNALKETPPVK